MEVFDQDGFDDLNKQFWISLLNQKTKHGRGCVDLALGCCLPLALSFKKWGAWEQKAAPPTKKRGAICIPVIGSSGRPLAGIRIGMSPVMRRPLARSGRIGIGVTQAVGLNGRLTNPLTAVVATAAGSRPLARTLSTPLGKRVIGLGVADVLARLELVHLITKLAQPKAAALGCMHTILKNQG